MKPMLYVFTATLVACGASRQNLTNEQATGLKASQGAECHPGTRVTPGSFDLDPLDMNGNGRNDLSVYRPSDRYWYWQNEETELSGLIWGQSGDFMMPQDYDGDGRSDLAVFRPSVGVWYILTSQNGWTTWSYQTFGEINDEPVAGDYDADCKADLAIWTPQTGHWSIRPSRNPEAQLEYTLGSAWDTPVADDYDGDSRADPAVYRNGRWNIILSTTGKETVRVLEGWPPDSSPFERPDLPVQMNYDGDARGVDLATFNPTTGIWRIAPTSGEPYTVQFGGNGDLPVPGFYSGQTGPDRTTPAADIAVFRAGTWYIRGHHQIPHCFKGWLEKDKATVCQFGLPGDLPIHRQKMP